MPALLPGHHPWGKGVYGRYAGNDHLELPELADCPYGGNRAPLDKDPALEKRYHKPSLEGLCRTSADTGPAGQRKRGNGL